MTKLKIRVTKDVLRKSMNCYGTYGSNCAIAVAVRDIFPTAYIGRNEIFPFFYHPIGSACPTIFSIRLPTTACRLIDDFDDSTPEERLNLPELEFEISVPDAVIEKINIDEVQELLKNHPTLTLVK